MMCESPFYDKIQGLYFPCGKCIPCKIKRKMEWTTRLKLEATQHDKSCFITLTYNDDNLTYGGLNYPTLVSLDITLFLKRFRKQLDKTNTKIRYFVCGEYGDTSNRPHYHLIVFGVDESCRDIVDKCWNMGHVKVLPLEAGAIEYCAGYCVKKSIDLKQKYHDLQVAPEFFRGSLGLGRYIVDKVAVEVIKNNAIDVPRYVTLGKKKKCILQDIGLRK